MDYNLALNMFMEGKKERICKDLRVKPTLYYKAGDRQAIKRLSKKKAEAVWNSLVESIKDGARSLGQDTCPFCINVQNDCDQCVYRKRHNGRCGGYADDYEEILNARGYNEQPYRSNTSKRFSNSFYKRLIRKIKKELK